METILVEVEDAVDGLRAGWREMPKMQILEEVARKLQKHQPIILTGAFDGRKHAWILLRKSQCIVDLYADEYHFRIVASEERIRARGARALDLGLCVTRSMDMPEYKADTSTEPDPVPGPTPCPKPGPVITPPIQKPPAVWNIGMGGIVKSEEYAYTIAKPQKWVDLRGFAWIGRADTGETVNEFLHGAMPNTRIRDIYLTRGGGIPCDDRDPEFFLVPILYHLHGKGGGEYASFLYAINLMVRVVTEIPRKIGFAKMTTRSYPFRGDGDYATAEIADRCIPEMRDVVVSICERFRCKLVYEHPYLFVARKHTADLGFEVAEYASLADVDEIAKILDAYLTNPHRDAEIQVRIHTDLLVESVVKKRRTVYVSERHLTPAAMRIREIFHDHIHYGQATVGGFAEESCILTIHRDLTFFVGSQRGRAIRKLQQYLREGACPETTTTREGEPSIQLSKGMFRDSDGSARDPLSAHDASWFTFHPADYKDGELLAEFKDDVAAELEPLILKDRYALICNANLTELLIRPTLECLPKMDVIATVRGERSVHCIPRFWNKSIYIEWMEEEIKQEEIRLHGYGGVKRKVQLEIELVEKKRIYVSTKSCISLFSESDGFQAFFV
jgi:hypothetical protein